MTPPDKCPRCGADRLPSDYSAAFTCGTLVSAKGNYHHTVTCHYLSEFRKPMDAERDALAARVKELEEDVIMLSAYGNQLNDELYPPPRNCSCHICAPCADCEQWESQRIAKADWDSAIKRASKAKEKP